LLTLPPTDLLYAFLVHKYNQLMKDFPLNELLSATDLDKIQESLDLILGHINRKLKFSLYPIRRALPLVEAIPRSFASSHPTDLRTRHTKHSIVYFHKQSTFFRTWDDLIKEFTNVARGVARKRSEKFIPIKVLPAHGKLQERVRYLRDWRKQHEQLAMMTGPTKGLASVAKEVGGMDMEEEVNEAYKMVKCIDVLDVSQLVCHSLVFHSFVY